jgi:Ca2+-transporting ATPase
MKPWHLLSTEETIEQADTTLAGLSDEEVSQRMSRYGKNRIEEKKQYHPLIAFLSKFNDFMSWVLLAAAIIAGFAGDFTDTVIILVIVLINAIVGFIQEYKAEKAMKTISQMAALKVSVVRNGQTKLIPSEELVPGDLLLLEAGNVVGADIRLIETNRLFLDESMLTGESIPAQKITSPLLEADIPLGDRTNLSYKGTQVTGGKGKGIVIETGMQTQLGSIAGMLQQKEGVTPLQSRMAEFSKKLSYIIIGICLTLFLIGYLRKEDPLQMLLTTISLAVAAIPEALPALITVALARGAKRMIKKNVLVRKLNAVETLGSVTYICTDKTGTLTQNKMKVVVFDQLLPIDSSTYSNSIYHHCLALNQDVLETEDGTWSGDPTEIALAEYFVSKYGKQELFELRERFRRISEIPFDANRKCMTTVHAYDNRYLIITKGAAESLSGCWNKQVNVDAIEQQVATRSGEGLRVMVYGYKILNTPQEIENINELEKELIPVAIVGMIDPPRNEVKEAISQCKTAGIHTVMITGDHPKTAAAIATQIGLLGQDELTITGKELDLLSEEVFKERIEKIRVYARVSPEQKLRIVKTLQEKGHFVAMTGDGVNDAPSLKAANIGVAMGIAGTDVSKQVAKMILTDDHFASIVNGVKEGRRIYDNIRKFVKYIMTCNGAEIWALLLAPFFGMPIPLLPIHILWINLVTDGIPGLTLANEKSEPGLMKKPPRDPNESLFSIGTGFHIVWVGLLMAAITLGVQAWALSYDHAHWQSMVFTVLSLSQLAHILAIRREKELIFFKHLLTNPSLLVSVSATFFLQLAVLYVPFANDILKTAPLTFQELTICIMGAAVVFHAVEIEKMIRNRKSRF